MLRSSAVSVLAVLLLAQIAYASGDIVYSARYYLPPGSRGMSHFHIYRIDSDGAHRRQLTFSDQDDHCPVWSPDGKHIALLRTSPDDGTPTYLMIITANGKVIGKAAASYLDSISWKSDNVIEAEDVTSNANHVISYSLSGKKIGDQTAPSTDDQMFSPDRNHYYQSSCGCSVNDSGQIVDVRAKQIVGKTSYDYSTVAWLDNSSLAGIRNLNNNTKLYWDTLGLNGKAIKSESLRLTNPTAIKSPNADFPDQEFVRLQQFLASPVLFITEQNWHNSTVGADNGVFLIDFATETLTFLSDSQFIAWSPNKHRFCGAPGKVTTNYLHKADGTWRTVWTAPLQIVDVSSRKVKTIQGGFVWVDGADWKSK